MAGTVYHMGWLWFPLSAETLKKIFPLKISFKIEPSEVTSSGTFQIKVFNFNIMLGLFSKTLNETLNDEQQFSLTKIMIHKFHRIWSQHDIDMINTLCVLCMSLVAAAVYNVLLVLPDILLSFSLIFQGDKVSMWTHTNPWGILTWPSANKKLTALLLCSGDLPAKVETRVWSYTHWDQVSLNNTKPTPFSLTLQVLEVFIVTSTYKLINSGGFTATHFLSSPEMLSSSLFEGSCG